MKDKKAGLLSVAAAVRSPRDTLLHPQFWLAHGDYMALMASAALVVGLIAYRIPETLVELRTGVPADSSADWLGATFVIFIGGLSLWAIAATTRALAETMVDRNIAIVIEARADRKLKELGPGALVDLGALNQVLPANKSKPEPAMIRLAQELLKEARNLRFDARPHLIRRYRSDITVNVFRLERLQKYSLRLGILGTFVGLILALSSLSELFDAPPVSSPESPSSLQSRGSAARESHFRDGSRVLLGSLRLAFGTSIAGLAASLFIGAQAEIVRRRHRGCFRHMDDAALSLTTLASHTLSREDLLASLEDNTGAMKTLQDQIYDQSRKIEVSLAGLDRRIEAQTTQIEAGLARLTEHRDRLDSFLGQIEASHRRFLTDLAAVYDRAALERMIGRIEESVDTLGEDLSNELRAKSGQVVTQFDRLLHQIGASHKSFLTDLETMFAQAGLEELIERIPRSVTGLGERMSGDIQDGILDVAGQFEALRDQVEVIEKNLAETAQDLTEKTSAFQAAIHSIDSQVREAAQESRRTMQEVPPALRAVRSKLDSVRSGSLVVFDAPLLKKLLLCSIGGLLLGSLFDNPFVAFTGMVVGPALLLTLPMKGGLR